MKVTFRKDKVKKHICSVCDKQFNWDNNSYWLGQLDNKPEAIVCSDKCKKQYKQH